MRAGAALLAVLRRRLILRGGLRDFLLGAGAQGHQPDSGGTGGESRAAQQRATRQRLGLKRLRNGTDE